MAKNIIEQFLGFAAAKLAGPIAHENIYREESTEMTGVAKYLARQEMAAQAQEAAIIATAATGVEKYLARQAALAAGSAPAAEAPQAPLTGVAKYLAGQYQAAKPAAAAAPLLKPEPIPEPKTGVAKYMASLGNASATAEDVKKKPVVKPAGQESITGAEPHAAETSKPVGSIIHLNDDKQCQASTSKGAQCKHTSNLGHIQRTINKQKYLFSVCNQHHNDAFKPFATLLDH